MRRVHASLTVPGTVHEAESLWYDTSRWSEWIVGLARVRSVSDEWPRVGAEVHWESGPAGRGTVRERVVEYRPLELQTVEVEDDSIGGRQSVAFVPNDGHVTIELSLSYELKRRSLPMAVVDLLFIRRAMTNSLEETLARFGTELQAARETDVG